jgi:hypothetical protein
MVDTQFLGEYDLGLQKLLITDVGSGAAVLDLESSGPNIEGSFYLFIGPNRIDQLDRGRSRVSRLVPRQGQRFVLEAHRTYQLAVCGNNGWGFLRCSTRAFVL